MKKIKPIELTVNIDRSEIDGAIVRVDELADKLNMIVKTMKEIEEFPVVECFEKMRADFWHNTALKSVRVVGYLGGALIGIIIAKFL